MSDRLGVLGISRGVVATASRLRSGRRAGGGILLRATCALVLAALAAAACGPGAPPDPRKALLQADRKAMDSKQYAGIEPLSQVLGKIFVEGGNKKLQPEKWDIFTRAKGDRLLILVRVPKLQKSAKGSRLVFLKMVESAVTKSNTYRGKKLYLALQGRAFLGAAKTPTYESDSFPVRESELYEFYGPASEFAAAKKEEGAKK